MERFADTVRREYLAVGFRVAPHPQIDLATEPRWSRQSGTFGSSAQVSGELAAAYVRGLQGPRLGPRSVAAMVKHFPGGGPQKDGEDPHFPHARSRCTRAACASTTWPRSGRPWRPGARR
ncbi:glycoside hydrolase family 3 N-terminal domain-containing protein [Streptomyces sp. NPDC000345]|uniref:glycoside hydrolase family 3 N-terminal domain-containing protein n=1 Tax=Streptomyces sp. NPDC000345 TaxID=3364537 RepID=UPI0036CE9C34